MSGQANQSSPSTKNDPRTDDPRTNDTALFDAYPGEPIDRDNAFHYRGWLDRRLLMNRCGDCGHWQHPAQPICPQCWSSNLVPTEISGRGRIHLLMLLRQGPPAPGVDYTAGPHPVLTVELVEQTSLRLTATAGEGVDVTSLAIDQPVRLSWITRGGFPVPAFVPDPSSK